MANTYTIIASNTLSSSAASVTFSSIPGTYTDLVLRVSARTTATGLTWQNLIIQINGLSTSVYSRTLLVGDGSAASSTANSNQTNLVFTYADVTSLATANTFSSTEIYLPNYTVSQNKPISGIGINEGNYQQTYISAMAGLFRDTGAISSIVITANSGSYVSGSSFFLYGIKKD